MVAASKKNGASAAGTKKAIGRRRTVTNRVIIFCLANALSLSQGVALAKGMGTDCNPARMEQAAKLISDSQAYCESSRLFLAQAEETVKEAKKLQGQARQYTKNLKINAPLLKGQALSDAKKQFQLDLSQFSKHAKQYKLHTDQVRQQYGHCQASMEAYDKFRKELELHCDQFHMPNIEPPHICLELGTSAQEAASMQNRVAEQMKRVAIAEKQLMEAESRLSKAEKMSDAVDGIVRTNTDLALKEQDLAAEFARLKEEHRQLDVARRALQRSGVRTAIPRVHGKVKTK
jgi:hypothetical protein